MILCAILTYFKRRNLRNNVCRWVSGATSAPSLIFILPGVFYLRIVPEEQEPLKSRPKIQVRICNLRFIQGQVTSIHFVSCFPGHFVCGDGFYLHDNEHHLHRSGMGDWTEGRGWSLTEPGDTTAYEGQFLIQNIHL